MKKAISGVGPVTRSESIAGPMSGKGWGQHATVRGPISGGAQGRPFGTALSVDLADYGYVEEEFFIEGLARTFGPKGGTELTSDGRWKVVETGSAAYKTRMLVRRPTDPRRFNGTVLVVWLNASAGFEIGDFGDPQLLERGYAQVFVSAQRDGLEGIGLAGPTGLPGLRAWDPQRYGSLSIPSNDLSFDIFTQAGRAVGPNRARGPVDPMSGLRVKRTIAYGGSQSAAWLATYFNAVQPIRRVFDGVMPILHFGAGRPLATGVTMPTSLTFRTDQATPVFVMNTENETETYAPARQADTDRFRYWEYTGLNHTGGLPGAARLAAYSQREFGFPFPVPQCARPLDTLEVRYVFPAAVVAFDNWLRTGVAPSRAVPIALNGGTIERDAFGTAIGGIKIPPVAVPTAAHGAPNGERSTDLACFLQGYEVPFDAATLALLYPSDSAYFAQVGVAADEAALRGFILPEDAAAEKERATQAAAAG